MPASLSRECHSLICHPAAACPAVQALEVRLGFAADGALLIDYRLQAEMAAILLPAAEAPGFKDGLWQHSCCEIFIAAVDQPAYREFNFSPSGQWALYDFSQYRQRNTAFQFQAEPAIRCHLLPDEFRLSARLAPALLPPGEQLVIGLSAVIETVAGEKSYWALQHAAAQPDFHLRQSFSLTLKVNQ